MCSAIIGDSTDNIHIDVWENYIPQVQQGKVYSIAPVQMRSFKGEKKISTVMSTVIQEIQDAHQLNDLSLDDDSTLEIKTVTKNFANIDHIDKLDTYLKCQKCSKKILQATSKVSVRCDYCGQYMRSKNCKSDICVKFSTLNDDEMIQLTTFGSALQPIFNDIFDINNDEIADRLLLLQDFKITYNNDTMIVDSFAI